MSFTHPPLVESSSSIVQQHEAFDLKTRGNLGTLTELQITTILKACQTHLKISENGIREGFYLHDKAGVGRKCITGIIWENWNLERKKTLWVSCKPTKKEAETLLGSAGAECIKVLTLRDVDASNIKETEGVVIISYRSLIAKKWKSRSDTILEWFGDNYDGLIIFDECHKDTRLVSEAAEQSLLCKNILQLQEQVPNARVVYSGKSDYINMKIISRLNMLVADEEDQDDEDDGCEQDNEDDGYQQDGPKTANMEARIMECYRRLPHSAKSNNRDVETAVSEWITLVGSNTLVGIMKNGNADDGLEEVLNVLKGVTTEETLSKDILKNPVND